MAAPSKTSNTATKSEKPKDTGRFISATEGWKITLVAKKWEKAQVPYVTGGKTLKGADCSGSVWAIYKEAGFSYGPYANTVMFVNKVATDPDFIAAWLQKLVGTDKNFVQGKHFFKKVTMPQAGDIGLWKGHMAIYDNNVGKTEKGQDGNLWSASRTGGRDFGPARVDFYDGKDGFGKVVWYRYWMAP